MNYSIDLSKMNEKLLFQYFKLYIPDIVDLNEEDEHSPLDWFIPSQNLYIETKCRTKHFPTFFLQEDKWNEMMKVENCYYLNSTPKGVGSWDIKKIDDPVFFRKFMEKSQQFNGQGEYVPKMVTELIWDRIDLQWDQVLFTPQNVKLLRNWRP